MTAIRILLTIVFGWTLLKTIGILMRQDSMDLLLLSHAGLGWSFWVIVPTIAVLLLGALAYLWVPTQPLYRTAQAAVVLGVLETSLVGIIAMNNPQAAKDAFVASRIGRGLPVRDEVVQLMDSPASHLLPLCIGIALAGVWLFLLHLLERQRLQISAVGERA